MPQRGPAFLAHTRGAFTALQVASLAQRGCQLAAWHCSMRRWIAARHGGGVAHARGRFNCESYDSHTAAAKAELEAKVGASTHAKPGMVAPVGVGADAESGGGDDEDLDDFSKAAIASLSKRDKKKRQEAAQKKRDKTKSEAAAALVTAAAAHPKAMKAMKAAKVEPKAKAKAKAKATKAAPATKLKKKPAAAKPEPVDMSKKNAPMPKPQKGSEAPPSNYNGGRIYYKNNIRAFRATKKYPIFGSEKKVRWAKDAPNVREWKSALEAIDKYKP